MQLGHFLHNFLSESSTMDTFPLDIFLNVNYNYLHNNTICVCMYKQYHVHIMIVLYIKCI